MSHIISYQHKHTHSSEEQQAGQWRNSGWETSALWSPSFVLSIYSMFSPASNLTVGYIFLSPLIMSNNIIYFIFFGSPSVYEGQKRVCMVGFWNLVSCVSIFHHCALLREILWVKIMEKNITYTVDIFYMSVEVCAPGGQDRAGRSQRVDKEWDQSALTFDNMSEEDGIWLRLWGWLSLSLIRWVTSKVCEWEESWKLTRVKEAASDTIKFYTLLKKL